MNSVPSFSFRWIGPTWCPVDLLGGSERATKYVKYSNYYFYIIYCCYQVNSNFILQRFEFHRD